MATTKLGNKAVGSIVKLKENGTLVDYLIVHQGIPGSIYDSSCNGTWILRKDISETRAWHSSRSNNPEVADLISYLKNSYLSRFETSIQSAIKQVKIPYSVQYSKKTGADGMSCKMFLLSAAEIGAYCSMSHYIPGDGVLLSYFSKSKDSLNDVID